MMIETHLAAAKKMQVEKYKLSRQSRNDIPWQSRNVMGIHFHARECIEFHTSKLCNAFGWT